jgi:hypothetical protein
LYIQLNAVLAGRSGKYVMASRRTRTAARRPTPTWDPDLRELQVGALVVKRFRQPARNQVTVLASFQELRWPRRIDDPLTGNSDVEPKRRLRDTVFALNRNQVTATVLVFEADGTGTGIIWRWRS